jgi:1-acyl-sn-glycerol-3-phosphate acyltransferase
MSDSVEPTSPVEKLPETGWYGLKSFSPILEERSQRIVPEGKVTGRSLLGLPRKVSLGVSPHHYRFFCALQLQKTCLNKWPLRYEGLDNIPVDRPCLFVMKHRGFSDITLHGFGYAWATSKLYGDAYGSSIWENPQALEEILSVGKSCRFVMKDALLNLPIGLHLVINGGIPVPQDLETKALNTPGFDAKDPKALSEQKKLGQWFNFKDSYREILETLKGGGGVMIYGEATRVQGDQMGHLSLKMIQRLARVPNTALVPVGSKLEDGSMVVSYGEACELDQLRDNIAQLSGINKDQYL